MIKLTYWQLFLVKFYQWRLRSLSRAILALHVRASNLLDGEVKGYKVTSHLGNAYITVNNLVDNLKTENVLDGGKD